MGISNKLFVIINPISGTGNKADLPGLIEEILDKSKWDITTRYTKYPGHATALASEAAQQGYFAVVAIGGDGTINEVASALINTPTALGFVPTGSGNGLARHLHIPSNAKKALEIINDGYTEEIDYCTVNGRPFFCTSGVGLDAMISHKFAKAGSRGMKTYLRTAVTAFFDYHGEQFKITVDGKEINENAHIVTCCNAAQYGNNAIIAPRASISDGLIDVTVVRNFNIFDGPILGVRMLTNKLEQDRHVHFYRGRHVVVERQCPGITHIDGDPCIMPKKLDFKCVKDGLKVLLRHHKRSL